MNHWQPPVDVVLPAAAPSAARSSGGLRPHRPLSLPLSEFLRASRLDVWGLALQQEQMTVGLLASLSFADLRAALPSVLVGILLKMQVAAKNWIEKSVSTLVLL